MNTVGKEKSNFECHINVSYVMLKFTTKALMKLTVLQVFFLDFS